MRRCSAPSARCSRSSDLASLAPGPAATDLAALAGPQAGLDNATTTRIVDQMAAHPTAGIAIGLFVIGHILGTMLLGIALWRGRMMPLWAAVALIVSQPPHFVFAVDVPNGPLDATLGWGLTAVGLAAAGIALARQTEPRPV